MMRDRLIKIVKDSLMKNIDYTHRLAENITDDLLANGVIVPPCKVGDTVFVPTGDEEQSWIDEYKVKYFYCSSKDINRIYIECGTMGKNFKPKYIGKTVFFTREEAEQALKGGEE